AAIAPIVLRDNDETVRLLMPRFLLIPQVLRGLGVAAPGGVTLTLSGPGSSPARDIHVDPISMADYNAWAGPYGLHLPANSNVPYLSRIDDALWWTTLPDPTGDGSELFVQYNRVDPLPATQLAALEAALRAPSIDRVILDVRHNYGGELHALDPIVTMFEDPVVNKPDSLSVATARNPFSAGSLLVARLDKTTPAEIVGEPMGGCPTFYSDSTDLTLPGTGISISVADD